jgi:hypothetical protein
VAVQYRSDGWRWRGIVERLTGETRSGEVVQELVVSEVLVSGDGDEVVDEVQQMTAISKSWSARTCASRGDGEARLETTAASVIVGVLEILREIAG